MPLVEAQRAIGERLIRELADWRAADAKLTVDAEYVRAHSDLNPDAMSRRQVGRFAEALRTERDSQRLLDIYWQVHRRRLSVDDAWGESSQTGGRA